jgi:hypothetical protein
MVMKPSYIAPPNFVSQRWVMEAYPLASYHSKPHTVIVAREVHGGLRVYNTRRSNLILCLYDTFAVLEFLN